MAIVSEASNCHARASRSIIVALKDALASAEFFLDYPKSVLVSKGKAIGIEKSIQRTGHRIAVWTYDGKTVIQDISHVILRTVRRNRQCRWPRHIGDSG